MAREKIKADRDVALIEDYKRKTDDGKWAYTITQLGLRYARYENGEAIPLTHARIHQILNANNVENRVVRNTSSKPRRRK